MAVTIARSAGLPKAINRLKTIREEIAKLEAEAAEIEGALSVLRRFGPLTVEDVAPQVPPADAPSSGESRPHWKQGNVPTMSQAEFEVIAARIINEAGRPLTRSDVIEKFAEAGTPITGDASKNAGTKLWRARKTFINIRGAGYWLRKRECPAVGYDPVFHVDPEPDHDPDGDDSDTAA